MRINITITAFVAAFLALTLSARSARAVVLASDNANNSAYNAETDGAWKGTTPSLGENPAGNDNGGTGFQPWSFAGGFHFSADSAYGTLDHFIDGVDFPESTFNNIPGTRSFGLANALPLEATYETAVATRPFSLPLAVGDVFSIDLDTPAVYDDANEDRYPFAIISFNDLAGNKAFGLSAGNSAVYGEFPWVYADFNSESNFGEAAGVGSMSPTSSSNGTSLKLEVLSGTTAKVTFNGGTVNLITFGKPDNPSTAANEQVAAGLPASISITLFANNSGDGNDNPTGEREFFFNNLKIEHLSAGVAGDYNNNGVVDAADYAVWRDNNNTGATLPNDSTPGTVNAADYTVWKANFGKTAGSGSVVSGAGVVPEPASALLLVLGASILAMRAVRRSR